MSGCGWDGISTWRISGSMLEGGCACGSGSLPADVGAADHPLLPLPELPASDRERVRHQPADRDRPRRAAGRRAAPGGRALGTTAARSRSSAVRPARWRCTATTRTRACFSCAAGRSTTRRQSRPTSTSSPGRRSPGSRCRTRCRRSTSTTTCEGSGPPRASNASRRSGRPTGAAS